jgi:hypothetical protein
MNTAAEIRDSLLALQAARRVGIVGEAEAVEAVNHLHDLHDLVHHHVQLCCVSGGIGSGASAPSQ